jgi:hypothetical protein
MVGSPAAALLNLLVHVQLLTNLQSGAAIGKLVPLLLLLLLLLRTLELLCNAVWLLIGGDSAVSVCEHCCSLITLFRIKREKCPAFYFVYLLLRSCIDRRYACTVIHCSSVHIT